MGQTERKSSKCLKSIKIPLMIIGYINSTAQKKKFSIKDFISKCNQICNVTEEILNGKLYFWCSAEYRKQGERL